MAEKKRGDVKNKVSQAVKWSDVIDCHLQMCKFLSEKKNCLSLQKKSISQFIKDKRGKGRQRTSCSGSKNND